MATQNVKPQPGGTKYTCDGCGDEEFIETDPHGSDYRPTGWNRLDIDHYDEEDEEELIRKVDLCSECSAAAAICVMPGGTRCRKPGGRKTESHK